MPPRAALQTPGHDREADGALAENGIGRLRPTVELLFEAWRVHHGHAVMNAEDLAGFNEAGM